MESRKAQKRELLLSEPIERFLIELEQGNQRRGAIAPYVIPDGLMEGGLYDLHFSEEIHSTIHRIYPSHLWNSLGSRANFGRGRKVMKGVLTYRATHRQPTQRRARFQ